jgi:hypothetical protein
MDDDVTVDRAMDGPMDRAVDRPVARAMRRRPVDRRPVAGAMSAAGPMHWRPVSAAGPAGRAMHAAAIAAAAMAAAAMNRNRRDQAIAHLGRRARPADDLDRFRLRRAEAEKREREQRVLEDVATLHGVTSRHWPAEAGHSLRRLYPTSGGT